jgi:hypothetical protein
MSSFSPNTPTLPSYNPVRRSSIPYQIITQGLFRRFSYDTEASYDEDEVDHLISNSYRERRSLFRNLCGCVLLALASLLLGLVAGHFIQVENKLNGHLSMSAPLLHRLEKFKCIDSHNTEPYDRSSALLQDVVWNKNRTFADAPSELTEAAWATLIPNGRGFIRHPRLTSNKLKSVSAFHETHCLVSSTRRERYEVTSLSTHVAWHQNGLLQGRIPCSETRSVVFRIP